MPRLSLVTLFAAVLLASSAASAQAEVEEVMLIRASEDDAVIERANGDRYRLDLRQSCPVAQGLTGRKVLLYSAHPFRGGEARLLVPQFDQDCRVLRADSIGHVKPAAAPVSPDAGLRAVREALELLGYNCGARAPVWGTDAAQALLRYRESRKLDSSANGLRRTLTALALDVMGGRQATGTGLRVSRAITDHAPEVTDFLSGADGGAGAATCSEPTWVRARAEDGARITLADGTVWEPAADKRERVAAWPSSDDVLACSGRLVNVRTGEMVRATRLH